MANKWFLRIATLLVWALAAGSATLWMLKFIGSRTTAMAIAPLAPPAPSAEAPDLAHVLGSARSAAPAAVASAPKPLDPGARFVLVGVVADRARLGVALISVEGKAARPYRVGSVVDDGYTLKSVATRSATLTANQTGMSITVELPLAANAVSTNVRPVPGPFGAASAALQR